MGFHKGFLPRIFKEISSRTPSPKGITQVFREFGLRIYPEYCLRWSPQKSFQGLLSFHLLKFSPGTSPTIPLMVPTGAPLYLRNISNDPFRKSFRNFSMDSFRFVYMDLIRNSFNFSFTIYSNVFFFSVNLSGPSEIRTDISPRSLL